MKKKIIILVIGIIILLFLILFLFFKTNKNSYYLGKWYYKYTYLSNDKLHYTEEDGMESYIILYSNNTYIYSDYAGDIVNKGIWLEFKKGAYLVNENLWLYKSNNGTLKTEIKNGKDVGFDYDFYNVLIRR